MRIIKKIKIQFFRTFAAMDSVLKFPNLKKGDIGIQAGFDMGSSITSDLFQMRRRVGKTGLLIGIDPDPENHRIAEDIIRKRKISNITLLQKATFSKRGQSHLLLGEKQGWNQIDDVPVDSTVSFTGRKLSVETDTLDHILSELAVDIQKIAHINLTVNGAEYDTLLGMDKILNESENLSLTIIAGRYDESGTIHNRPDYELIIELLKKYNFSIKFCRIHQLFWWGFTTKLLINRKWIYGKENYGVVMACKGRHNIKWYQSFS